ncbi:MAG: FtsX-like permease family protein, partial [Nitrospiraceae bacterium]|nr:FtsX-like permease family protein [Nitrospiraceae bacterium]
MIGVGVGCAMALVAASWLGGEKEMIVRAVSESGGGHLRVVPEGWTEMRENTLRLANWKPLLERLRSDARVDIALTRARTNGLLAFGNRMAGVQILGVEPDLEKVANRLVSRAELEGRYLQPGDRGKVVIGHAIAKSLDVEVDDDLFVTLAGRDEIQSAMLNIVGILSTGNRETDNMICHVTQTDVEELSGYEGPGEIAILLHDYTLVDSVFAQLSHSVGAGNEAITWKEVNPGLAAGLDSDIGFTRLLVCIIVLVVSLGIASAQLTAVLERRAEFAILSALGMKSRQVAALMLIEAIVIGLGGAVVALGVGGATAYYLSTKGFDMAAMMGEDLSVSFGDVMIDPIMYG